MEQQKSLGIVLHFENIATGIQTKKAKDLPDGGRDYTYIIFLYSHKKYVYLQICSCSS